MKNNPKVKSVRAYLESRFDLNPRAWREGLEEIVTRTTEGREHIAFIMTRFQRADRTEALEAELFQAAAFILGQVKLTQKSDRR